MNSSRAGLRHIESIKSPLAWHMRDNFSSKTADALAKRVAYRCSNPSCRKRTIGPGTQDDRSASIGTAAHITGASGLGPRYDKSIQPSQRSHISNGIWLCADCGRLVDSDQDRFSIELLRNWKKLAESEALAELKGGIRKPSLIGDPFLSVDLNPATEPNPQAFYQGSPASYADLAANLDIQRTQYVRPWKDDRGQIRRPWKEEILGTGSNSLVKPRIRFLIGHRGTGRTTLLRRIAFDLREAQIPCVDLLLSGMTPEHVDPLLRLAAVGNGVLHIVAALDDVQSRPEIAPFLAFLRQFAASRVPAVILLRVNSSDSAILDAIVTPIAEQIGYRCDTLPLRPQIDDIEMSELLDRLTDHRCLYFLNGKPRDYQLKVLARKAKRSLIAILLEATRAPEGGEFPAIVWQDFQSLDEVDKPLYAFVALCHSKGLSVPSTLFDNLHNHIPGLQGFKERRRPFALAGLLSSSSSGDYSTRNRRLAQVFVDRFQRAENDRIVLSIFVALFRAIDTRRPDHKQFYKRLLHTDIFGTLQNPEPLITEIRHTAKTVLGPSDAARTMNSLIRVLQSRREYHKAFTLSVESLQMWRDAHNQASFLKGFCEYYLGRSDAAKRTAIRLTESLDLPYHFLHGVCLLRLLRNWKECREALDHFAQRYSSEIDRFPEYATYRNDSDLWAKVDWTNIASPHRKPDIELDRIEIVLVDGGATDEVILAAYQALTRRQPTFVRSFTSMFAWMNSPLPGNEESRRVYRYECLRDECLFHLDEVTERRKKYPRTIVSLLHSNLGRAIFRLDYIRSRGNPSIEDCEQHFRIAIHLRPDNWYAYNWLGTFIKEVKKDRLEAKLAYEAALAGDPHNPVFRYNLGRLYFEAAEYDESALANASQLAVQSREICMKSERWRSFVGYPTELAWAVSSLNQQGTLKRGDLLEPCDVIRGDVE